MRLEHRDQWRLASRTSCQLLVLCLLEVKEEEKEEEKMDTSG